MIKKSINKTMLLIASLISPTAFAHTGIHNNELYNHTYHLLSGIDHFLVVLIIALIAGAMSYYFYKK